MKAVSDLLKQPCNKSDDPIERVIQVVNSLFQTYLQQHSNKQCEHDLLKTCEHICNNLFADLSSEQVVPFLDYLNSKHPNIQFTHELENNGSLSFLDINITRTNGHFSTSVFHKLTSTGLFTKTPFTRYRIHMVTISN